MDTGRNKSNIISGGKISFFEREKVIGDKLQSFKIKNYILGILIKFI